VPSNQLLRRQTASKQNLSLLFWHDQPARYILLPQNCHTFEKVHVGSAWLLWWCPNKRVNALMPACLLYSFETLPRARHLHEPAQSVVLRWRASPHVHAYFCNYIWTSSRCNCGRSKFNADHDYLASSPCFSIIFLRCNSSATSSFVMFESWRRYRYMGSSTR